MVIISQVIKEFKISKYFMFGIISGIVTQLFFATFKIVTLNAFVSGNEAASPMNTSQTALYVWVTQMLFAIVPWNVNGKDFDSIRTGSIASELIRPVGLFKLIFVKTISWRMVSFLTRAIPIFFIAFILIHLLSLDELIIQLPTFGYFLMFLISVTFSLILSTLITVLLYSLAFFLLQFPILLGQSAPLLLYYLE